MREAQHERENRRRLARPKYIPLNAALLTTGVVLGVLALIATVPALMSAGVGFTGASVLFLIGLFIMLCAWLIYRRINHWFDECGLNGRVFLVLYAAVLVFCVVANYMAMAIWHQEPLIVGLAVHFVSIGIVVWVALRRSN